MNKEEGLTGTIYQEVCTWCGVVVRRLDTKNSRGMCLRCYARMLSDHYQRSAPTPSKTFRHSER
ncbi:MAG TPA: hypothetical protein VGX24_06035 [Pyrinomonadaceae bacterium]|jgi:hypothetical protein|nr:hypothetical protein [Pyrinomonadaceae bacterium]